MQPGPQSKSSRTGKGGFSDQDLVSLRPPASSFFPAPRPLKHRAGAGRGAQVSGLGSMPKRRVIAIFRTAPGAPGEILSQANGRSPVFSAGMNDLRLVHQLADNVQPPPAGALREHTRDRRLVYDGRSIIVDEDPKLRAIA